MNSTSTILTIAVTVVITCIAVYGLIIEFLEQTLTIYA